jgi:hypothetical protein
MNPENDQEDFRPPTLGWFSRRRGLFLPLEYVTEPLEFRTPARGGAFDFLVAVSCVWTDGGRSETSVRRRCEQYERQVSEMIAVTARDVLRCHDPDRTAAAEDDLNRVLDELARKGLGDRRPRWSARAEVTPHETVQAVLRTAWSRHSEVTALHEYSTEVIEKYRDTIGRWRRFLAELGIGELTSDQPAPFIAPHLVRLAADPGSAAGIIEELARRREDKDGELLKEVSDAIRNVEAADVNLFEYEAAQSSALSRLMEWAGFPVPRDAATGKAG